MNKWLAGLGALALSVSLSAQMEDVEITASKVTDTIYMLQGRGGNIGVSVGDDGVFMVDDQFAPLTERITAAIDKLSDSPIRFVINTHWHGDHTGGNENLGNQGVTIVAHDNVHKRMSTDQVIEAFNNTVKASPDAALPTITFNSRMTFHFNNDEIRIMHFPHSHTDGDSVLYFVNDNVVHAGDLFFNGSYPFIDTSSGGSFSGLIRSIEKLVTLVNDDTRIIPGHGPLATKQDLLVYLDMLKDVEGRLTGFLNEKKTLSAVELADPLKDYNDKWGQGFMKPEVWLRIIYTNMSEQ